MNIRASSSFRPGNVAAAMQETMTRNLTATTNAAQRVLDTSLETVAVASGELQSSGHIAVTVTGLVVTGSVIYDSDHAAYIEFGTGIRGAASLGAGLGISYSPDWPGMPAQPFLRPALDSLYQAILGDFSAAGFQTSGYKK